ncbi:MAG: DUF1858 domain-containing protein, partial [Planctomycetes bacterium]|nr:DUF1858 domain-containing protein [Planctomycetota bacterium]
PRFKYVKLWRPGLANLSFVGMLAGLTLRMAPALSWPGAVPLGLAGGLLEAASVALFVIVILRTLLGSPQKDSWDRYVLFSLACLTLGAFLEPLAFWLTRPGIESELLVRRVADFMGPYRNIQLLGFAGVMILGVGQRILPTAFGFREVGRRAGQGAFLLLAGGLILDVAGWILFRTTKAPGWALASWMGSSAYALGALVLAFELRAFTRGEAERSTKYVRAAFCWLAVACVMVFAEPFYAHALGLRFSHAYHGAIRHAFTVGFISLMILGVSSKVVPILQGIDVRTLPGLWIPFVLINAGNSLRVVSQVATDLAPGPAYPVMGLSGAFEVAGLAIWGVHLWRLMAPVAAPAAPTRGPITPDRTAASIVEEYPQTLDVFEQFGFKELRNPILRNTIARRVTIRMACGMKQVDEEKFLAALRDRARWGAEAG